MGSHSRTWSITGSHFWSIITLSIIFIIILNSHGLILTSFFYQVIIFWNIWLIPLFCQVVVFVWWCFVAHLVVWLWRKHRCMVGHKSQNLEKYWTPPTWSTDSADNLPPNKSLIIATHLLCNYVYLFCLLYLLTTCEWLTCLYWSSHS